MLRVACNTLVEAEVSTRRRANHDELIGLMGTAAENSTHFSFRVKALTAQKMRSYRECIRLFTLLVLNHHHVYVSLGFIRVPPSLHQTQTFKPNLGIVFREQYRPIQACQSRLALPFQWALLLRVRLAVYFVLCDMVDLASIQRLDIGIKLS